MLKAGNLINAFVILLFMNKIILSSNTIEIKAIQLIGIWYGKILFDK